jgi:hypothetical protein
LYSDINTDAAVDVTYTGPSVGEISKPAATLTKKDYLIAVRNRLFSVEEQIWLHDFAVAHPKGPKSFPVSPERYAELLRVRDELLGEYPLTKLYSDLEDAQHNNMTYASMYIDRMINNFNRQVRVVDNWLDLVFDWRLVSK